MVGHYRHQQNSRPDIVRFQTVIIGPVYMYIRVEYEILYEGNNFSGLAVYFEHD